MNEHLYTDDMGELVGLGHPALEASCRRMVMAAADWIAANPTLAESVRIEAVVPPAVLAQLPPGTHLDEVSIIASWEEIIHADSPAGEALLQAMHRACCADQGEKAGPSFLMMRQALTQASYIKARGWEDYVDARRRITHPDCPDPGKCRGCPGCRGVKA